MSKFDRIIFHASESFLRKLRQRLMITLMVVVLPILTLILYQAKVARDLRLADAQESAWEIAENVAARQLRFIDSAKQLLAVLAHSAEVADGDKPACSDFLRRFAEHNAVYVDLGVADADGNVRCRAHRRERSENVAGESHFQRAVATKGFAIGDYAVRGGSQRKSIAFALPVLGVEDAVRAVVFAALDLQWVNQLAAESRLPPGVALSIVDSRGILLARFPDPEKWIGNHIPDAPLFEMLRLRMQPSRELVGLDGVDRLYALKRLTANRAAAGQVYVMVGTPKALVSGQVNRALTRNLTWLMAVSFMAAAIAWLVGSKFVVGYVKVRVQAEEERARLAAIVESSEDAIIGMTLDGKITTWNDGAESTYGFSAQEILGKSILQLIPADHHDEIFELLDVVKQGRGINRYESKRKRKGGRLFDVSASLSPIRDVHRNVVGAATITRDITLLRKGEEQLLAYTDQLEALNLVSQEIAETLSVEQVIDRGLSRFISAGGLDFACVHFSQEIGGRTFYGVGRHPSSVDEIQELWSGLGGDFEDLFWQCRNPWFVDNIEAAPEFASAVGTGVKALAVFPLRQDPSLHAAITLLSLKEHSFGADERQFLQAMSRQIALAVENARLYGATVQANDELRREIEERKRAEQTLADFTAMVAHDLRSPLSNVVSITDSICEGVFGPISELQQKWLWKVQESCRSLINHVSDFLDISKIDAGKLQLTKTPAHLQALLQDGFVEHSVEAEKKGIIFTIEITDDLPRVFIDARRISQVVENLLSNAFKFTQNGGEISIGARRWGTSEALWWVKDSGIGIPREEFEHIFDKYRQVTGARSSGHNGTGLGLAICKKVVDGHGGQIWVESEPDKGSTFFVTLPAYFEQTEAREFATQA